MLGSPILYLKGMRTIMFQLSGFYCKSFGVRDEVSIGVCSGFGSFASLPAVCAIAQRLNLTPTPLPRLLEV